MLYCAFQDLIIWKLIYQKFADKVELSSTGSLIINMSYQKFSS